MLKLMLNLMPCFLNVIPIVIGLNDNTQRCYMTNNVVTKICNLSSLFPLVSSSGILRREIGRSAAASIWPLYGLYTASIWPLHGHYTASTRPIYGLYKAYI